MGGWIGAHAHTAATKAGELPGSPQKEGRLSAALIDGDFREEADLRRVVDVKTGCDSP
jgi:hypothetical protein